MKYKYLIEVTIPDNCMYYKCDSIEDTKQIADNFRNEIKNKILNDDIDLRVRVSETIEDYCKKCMEAGLYSMRTLFKSKRICNIKNNN